MLLRAISTPLSSGRAIARASRRICARKSLTEVVGPCLNDLSAVSRANREAAFGVYSETNAALSRGYESLVAGSNPSYHSCSLSPRYMGSRVCSTASVHPFPLAVLSNRASQVFTSWAADSKVAMRSFIVIVRSWSTMVFTTAASASGCAIIFTAVTPTSCLPLVFLAGGSPRKTELRGCGMRGKVVLRVRYCDARPCGRGCLSARGGVSHKEKPPTKMVLEPGHDSA